MHNNSHISDLVQAFSNVENSEHGFIAYSINLFFVYQELRVLEQK